MTNNAVAIDTRVKMKETLEIAKKRLSSINEIATSTMKTSGKFSWRNNKGDNCGDAFVDIFKCTSVFILCRVLGYIAHQEELFKAGAKEIGLTTYLVMEWCGYSYECWKNDIIIRCKILTQKEEEEKLQKVIATLSKYMTEEDRLQKDMEDVKAILETI
jgi:hypothetical protein